MKTDNGSIFHEDLVILDLKCKDRFEVISMLAGLLLARGFVKDSFCSAVIERENEMATGLPTLPFGVALPHTFCEHVAKTAIAVSTLSRPVEFQQMGDPGKKIAAEMVFLLSIREPAEQIDILKRLAEVFHKPETMLDLRAAKSKRKLISILRAEVEEKKY